MAEEGFIHTVGSGDCITSIADRNGHFWETVWEAPENADLRALRKDPNVLEAGDEIFVPVLRKKQESRATEAKHTFKKKGVPAKLRMRLMVNGKPRKNLRYVAVIDGVPIEGSTDDDGKLEIDLDPQAQSGTLTLHGKNGLETYDLGLGGLDPIETIGGVQQRLRNMGVPCEVTRVEDEQTKEAVGVFQGRQGLETTGELTDDVRSKIKAAHGA